MFTVSASFTGTGGMWKGFCLERKSIGILSGIGKTDSLREGKRIKDSVCAGFM